MSPVDTASTPFFIISTNAASIILSFVSFIFPIFAVNMAIAREIATKLLTLPA